MILRDDPGDEGMMKVPWPDLGEPEPDGDTDILRVLLVIALGFMLYYAKQSGEVDRLLAWIGGR